MNKRQAEEKASALTPNFSQHGDRRDVSEERGKQSNLHYLFEKSNSNILI